MARIHEGDDRAAVVISLADAEYHATCTGYVSGQVWNGDVFVYGSERTPYIIVVNSFRSPDGKFRVSTFGTMEPDALSAAYADCLPSWLTDK